MEEQHRGRMSERIKQKSLELLGYEISQEELRFMPYVHYVMVNEQRIEPRKINQEERAILSKWRKEGYLTGGMSLMEITKEFWDILSEIVFLAYVDLP